MAGETIQLFYGTHSATDRARMERVLNLASEIFGFNPDYISLTPGVKPSDYVDGNGSKYGWYLRSINGDLYVQPVTWNDLDSEWEHLGTPTVPKSVLDSRLSALEQSILDKKYIQSDTTNIDGSDQIENIVSLTQTEYDALGSKDANTMYVITDS